MSAADFPPPPADDRIFWSPSGERRSHAFMGYRVAPPDSGLNSVDSGLISLCRKIVRAHFEVTPEPGARPCAMCEKQVRRRTRPST